MVTRIRNWVYCIFIVSFAFLGVAEAAVAENTVVLFHNLPIPEMTKYTLPILTIAVSLGWLIWMLFRLGSAMEAEEHAEFNKTNEITTRIRIESPTVCLVISLIGIVMMDMLQDSLINWDYAINVYSYGILWLMFFPCVTFFLEFLQGLTGFPEFDDNMAIPLKKYSTWEGLVSCCIGIINLYLLITIANMSVCKYTYVLFVALLIYRLFRYYHLVTTLWTDQAARDTREIDEIDKKEGIL